MRKDIGDEDSRNQFVLPKATGFLSTLRWIDRTLARMEGWLTVLFLSLMVVLTFFQVALRALHVYAHLSWADALLRQFDWSESFVRILVLWLTFLGASLLTMDNKHIRIDILSGVLPPLLQPFRDFTLSIACMVVSVYMIKASADYVWMEWTFGGSLFLTVPIWIGQLIMPLGFSIILFRFFIEAIEEGKKILGRVRK